MTVVKTWAAWCPEIHARMPGRLSVVYASRVWPGAALRVGIEGGLIRWADAGAVDFEDGISNYLNKRVSIDDPEETIPALLALAFMDPA